MIQTLHASHNQSLYRVRLGGMAAVADLVREHRLETITSTDGSIVFWFAVHRTIRCVNRPAVEMLLAATRFTARNVPLLRGNVVLSGRGAAGDLASLTDEQVDWLVNAETGAGQDLVLGRRYAGDVRAQRRESRFKEAARRKAWLES